MIYAETTAYLDSFINYEKKSRYAYKESFKLERIKLFLSLLGNPQDNFKSIHVAGTKGKGSVCAFAAYILKEAGFKVGLYTSPHLSDCRERIRILSKQSRGKENGVFEGMIPRLALQRLVGRLRADINNFCKESIYGPLSFFEVYTILAFVYFKEQKIDFAVLETGLGGRLDATNVVNAKVSGITAISYDHTHKLGKTLTAIAREKAGIIKSREQIVVSAPQPEEAARVIESKCAQVGARLYRIGQDIRYKQGRSLFGSQEFSLNGKLGNLARLKISLSGKHQVINAVEAVSLVLALKRFNKVNILPAQIVKGLQTTCWPGRCELVSHKPQIMLDSAHNLASAKALKATVDSLFAGKSVILVLGISKDKDIKAVSVELVPMAKKIILTCANNPRSAMPRDIYACLKHLVRPGQVYFTQSVGEAIELAKKQSDKNELILVCGSIFVVGEARALLINN